MATDFSDGIVMDDLIIKWVEISVDKVVKGDSSD